MKKIKLRNPVARSPLLRKGGVHSVPKRHRVQVPRLQDAVLEWENERQLQDFVTTRKLSNVG